MTVIVQICYDVTMGTSRKKVYEKNIMYDKRVHCTRKEYTVRRKSTLYEERVHCTRKEYTVRGKSTLYDERVHFS